LLRKLYGARMNFFDTKDIDTEDEVDPLDVKVGKNKSRTVLGKDNEGVLIRRDEAKRMMKFLKKECQKAESALIDFSTIL
jgi:hypothetical protein